MPLVSVIMCCYNAMPFLKDAVASVFAQSFTDWELIISDDGSTDGSVLWLKENCANMQKVKIFFHSNNMGYVANKNFAHQQASGVFITQLDADDLMSVNRLEMQVAAADKHGMKIVGCGFERITTTGQTFEETIYPAQFINKRPTREGYPFWFPSLLVHQDVFKKVGYFHEYFSRAIGDDVYWTMRANWEYSIYHIPDILYSYRFTPNSIANDYKNERKLILPEIINRMSDQRQSTGNDYLAEGNLEKLYEWEIELKKNNRYMSEKYRMCAASAMQMGNRQQALMLIKIATRLNPFSVTTYRTWRYILFSK